MKELTRLIEESAAKLFESLGQSDNIELMESGAFPLACWQAFKEDGWLQTMLSEEQDGAGLGLAGGCVLMRLAGYYSVPLPVVESLLGIYLLAESGEQPNDNLYVPALVNTADEKTIHIQGVPWARHADGVVVVFAGEEGCQLQLVKRTDYQLFEGSNMAGEPRDDISFDSALLTNARSIVSLSIKTVESWLALARAAQISGALQSVFERTVEYANERSQFGRQIGKFQAVQQQLAVQAELTSAAICATDAAMLHIETEQEWECIVGAKIAAGEAAGVSAKTAHAVHAAIGFTHEYPLQLSTRRLWSWRDEYGHEVYWAKQLGAYFMQSGMTNLWSNLTKQTA